MTDLNKVNKSKERNKTIAAWPSSINVVKEGKGQAILSYHRSLYVLFRRKIKHVLNCKVYWIVWIKLKHVDLSSTSSWY